MWRFFYPQLQEAFPAQFGDVELDEFYGAINKVQPSLIRVEADEATYNLHIILRFELEQEILSGELPLEDLPEAWNARMAEYLGIEVPDDARGVLQDVHWSGGAIGYFPTYALGNVISVQLWDQAARGAARTWTRSSSRASSASSADWLRENLHRHGRKYTSKEMLDRIVGGPMDPARTCATSGRSSARSTDCRSKPAQRPSRETLATGRAEPRTALVTVARAALRPRRRSFVAARPAVPAAGPGAALDVGRPVEVAGAPPASAREER